MEKEIDRPYLEQLKKIIFDVMVNRFHTGIRPDSETYGFRWTVPNFETIANHKRISKFLLEKGEKGHPYLRQALEELVDAEGEERLVIKRRGELHSFMEEEALNDMFSLIANEGGEQPSKGTQYEFIHSQLGYGTPHDYIMAFEASRYR